MLNYGNSKVTMELRDVLNMTDENGAPFKLWDFEYPSYYEGEAKTEFEQKVIDHYLFRQIGAETPARFKHNFKTRIREIMPYYIQLYESEKYMREIDDPFATVDYTETFEQTSNDTSTGESSATSNSERTAAKTDARTASEDATHKRSDTPQGSISNLDNYMTEASVDDREQTENITSSENESSSGDTSASSSSTNTGTVKHTLTKRGAMGVTTFGHDMIEYRQSFLNIDMMIIENLNDLFLLIY